MLSSIQFCFANKYELSSRTNGYYLHKLNRFSLIFKSCYILTSQIEHEELIRIPIFDHKENSRNPNSVNDCLKCPQIFLNFLGSYHNKFVYVFTAMVIGVH